MQRGERLVFQKRSNVLRLGQRQQGRRGRSTGMPEKVGTCRQPPAAGSFKQAVHFLQRHRGGRLNCLGEGLSRRL